MTELSHARAPAASHDVDQDATPSCGTRPSWHCPGKPGLPQVSTTWAPVAQIRIGTPGTARTARREMPDTFHTITVLVGVSFPGMPRTHRRSSMTTISFENPSSDNKLKMKPIRHPQPLPSLTARDHLETLCVIAVAIDIAMSRDLGAKSCRAPVRLTTTMTGALKGPPQQPSRPARETPSLSPS